jgi:hypothetical protein
VTEAGRDGQGDWSKTKDLPFYKLPKFEKFNIDFLQKCENFFNFKFFAKMRGFFQYFRSWFSS